MHESKAIHVSLLLAFVLSTGGPGAQAGTSSEKTTAEEYFQRGVVLFNTGDYKGALENFTLSYEQHPHARIKFNIGMCHYLLGDALEAANELETLLSEEGADLEPAMKEKADEALADLEKKLAVLTFDVDVEGAAISVDGEAVGTSPIGRRLFVSPGSHLVAIASEGGLAWTSEVKTPAGKETRLTVVLMPPKTVKKTDEEAASDGGGTEEEKSLPPSSGKKSRAGQKAAGYALIALGAAALIVGAGTGGAALSKSKELDEMDEDCRDSGCNLDDAPWEAYKADRKETFDTADTLSRVSTAFFIVGGTAAVAGVLLVALVRPGKETGKKAGKTAWLPAAGIGPGGVVLSVDF
jgi:tetratricopeptide (TPR) repeat protein